MKSMPVVFSKMVNPGFVSDFRNRGDEQQNVARCFSATLQKYGSLFWNKLKISTVKTQNVEIANFVGIQNA